MLSAKKRKAKTTTQTSRAYGSRLEIHCFFPGTQLNSLTTKMAEPRVLSSASPLQQAPPASLTFSGTSDSYYDLPEALTSGQPSSPPIMMATSSLYREGDLQALIQALLTKAVIKVLILPLEDSHHKELKSVRAEVQTLADCLSTGEASVTAL